MPKIWHDTIATHREAVRDATLDAAAALVAEHGLAGVTMSAIAEATGIGRATLYKYFPDVTSILAAWHERMVAHHLQRLGDIAARPASPGVRLAAVLDAYAQMSMGHGHSPLAAQLHAGEPMRQAHRQLHDFIRGLVADAMAAGEVRADIPAGELAAFCLAALDAASELSSKAAIGRLLAVTLGALRP